MPRITLMQKWLAGLSAPHFPHQNYTYAPASSDASFRRYFRITFADGQTRIVMDAPPEHENCAPFVRIARLFKEAGVQTPEIYADNIQEGFLLLSDLGHTTYLNVLNADNARELYSDANSTLIAIQKTSQKNILPDYGRELMEREMNLFPDWYIARHLNLKLDEQQQQALHKVFEIILANVLSQPQVFVHRDYHSRNLMFCEKPYPGNPGILDFQDAVYGPLTYDPVSLYRDAYISWEEEQETDFVTHYWTQAKKAGLPVADSFDDFFRDYEWMGAQRQIKVIGIFARLNYRDGKKNYLNDIPRVMAYLRRTCERYKELVPLAKLLDQLENTAQKREI